ncbi:B3 domain-containing transcription factor VRN1-like isoform X2 [Lotus japonicus]|uniref:B3 domain-containing transcription factor VRN1-like isoform X2 n=1 Tax=Lotus japonicus TaxID=34305 RepID=UPI002589EF57|nr:B3 domain-containing transcription factor VRN1-like isoform X2 [Lotus japonicus]
MIKFNFLRSCNFITLCMVAMEAPILALPRFFKVIHDHEQQKETRIPKAVADKHWKGLSNPIVLKLPNGDDGWKIFWEKRDDGIWLHENWEKFSKLCSLRFGSLLVFDHKGASSFQILETPPLKKKKTGSNGEPESPPSERTKNNGKRKINVDIDATQQEVSDSGNPNMKSDKFEITVNTNYPNIPQEFMKKHNTIHGNYVKLKVEKSSWDVKVLKYLRLTRFSDGWRAFVKECELNVGDTCVFEMVDEKKLELQVTINKCHR